MIGSPDIMLAAAVALPLFGALVSVCLPERGPVVAMLISWANLGLAALLYGHVGAETALGGWEAPLGVTLSLDGLSWPFIALTAVVMALTGMGGAARVFLALPGAASIWLFLLAGLNALFLSADVFNLYVALEVVSLAAVAITALGGGAAVKPALRYLFVGLGGSLLYLVGVALLYRAAGALDLGVLSAAGLDGPVLAASLALMTVGLLMKAGVAPFHFWLPPAHGAAAPAASAVLSGVVVKAALYLLIRLWTDFAPVSALESAEPVFRVLGLTALATGAMGALQATRLKTLIAYSTVGQVGYVVFALGFAAGTPLAVKAAVAFMIAHGCAKAAVFIAAGALRTANGHDRIDDLSDPGARLGPAKGAVALGAIALMGLPPSGGFLAKWTLAEAALTRGHWWVAPLLVGGAILTSLKMVRLADGLVRTPTGDPPPQDPKAPRGWTALALGVAAMAAGFAGPELEALIVGVGP